MDASRELDSLLEVNAKESGSDSLDDLLNPTEDDVELRPKSSKKPKRIKSFRKSGKLSDNIRPKSNTSTTSKIETSEASAVLEEDKVDSISKLDDLMEEVQDNSGKGEQISYEKLSELSQSECKNNMKNTDIPEINSDSVNADEGACKQIEPNKIQHIGLPLIDNSAKINDIPDIDHVQGNKEDLALNIKVDVTKEESLDELLNASESDLVIRLQKSKKPRRIKSFRKSIKGSKDEIKQAITSKDDKQKESNEDKDIGNSKSNSLHDEKKKLSRVSDVLSEDMLKQVQIRPNNVIEELVTEVTSNIHSEVTSSTVIKHDVNDDADIVEINQPSSEVIESISTSSKGKEQCDNVSTSNNMEDGKIDLQESGNVIDDNIASGKENSPAVEQNVGFSVTKFEKEETDLEEMLKENNDLEETLDDILEPNEGDVIMCKKTSNKPKRIKSFRKSIKAPVIKKDDISDTENNVSMKIETETCELETPEIEKKHHEDEDNTKECLQQQISPAEPDSSQQMQEPISGEAVPMLPEISLENDIYKTVHEATSHNENGKNLSDFPVYCLYKPDDMLPTSKHDHSDKLHDIFEQSGDSSVTKCKPEEKSDNLVSPEFTTAIENQLNVTEEEEGNKENVKPKPSKRPKRVKSIRKSKIFVEDDYDPFASEDQKTETKKDDPSDIDQSLDSLLQLQPTDDALESNTLGNEELSLETNLLCVEEAPKQPVVVIEEKVSFNEVIRDVNHTIKPKSTKKPKRVKSIRKSKIFIDDDFDPFASKVQTSVIDQKGSNEDGQSLDSLLDLQPRDTVPESDNLMSLDLTHEKTTFDSSPPQEKEETKESDENDEISIIHDDNLKETADVEGFADIEMDSCVQVTDRQDGVKFDEELEEQGFSNGDFVFTESNEIYIDHDISNKINGSDVDTSFETSLEEVKKSVTAGENGMKLNSVDDISGTLLGQIKEPLANKDDLESLMAPDETGADYEEDTSPARGKTSYGSDEENKDEEKLQESLPETTNPVEDLFDNLDDQDNKTVGTEVKDIPVKAKQGKAKLKKSMERSFEDLLHGLSDESEPELDEMILSDDNDNTNLESILVSPEQSKSMKTDKSKDNFSTPARKTSTNDSMDILTSTPNTETNKETETELKVPPIEVKIDAPDDDEQEYDKTWEMVDREDNNKDYQDDIEYADEDEGDDDVVMRNKNKNSNIDSDDDKDIDLSAIEDANHLDVDINKHKSALGKKGSMALRRKQSRKSRRSVMATGEDAIFVDSTAPKSTDLMNGDNDYSDQEAEDDMSPPAKKPSPAMMVPLPGLSGKPPSQRLSASAPEEEANDAHKPAKRISKPPPGAFKLPDVMPRLGSKPTSSPIEPSKKGSSSTPSYTFEKPTLRSTKPAIVQDSSKEMENGFESPVLRSVGGKGADKTPVVEDRDVTFEKPMLRSTPKSRETTPDNNMDVETGTFAKPALKETPRKAQFDKKPSQDTPSENIIPRNLRSTNKPKTGQKPSAEKHMFDKPKLKSTGRTESVDKNEEQDKNENSYTFEKPVLRSAKKESQSNDTSDSSVSHKFEKPVLKNAGVRNMDDRKDSNNVGKFDKPSLRKTPSPEKEVKPSHEPKGTFDKPSLRKMDNSQSVTSSSSKSDYKTSFPEMKLRKTSSPQKEVVSDKPSWLKEAADKQSKVLDVLQAKENTNTSTNKDVPSWLDKTPKGTRGQPLQDASNSQSEQPGERKSSFTQRSRESSIGSENDPEKRKASTSELKAPQNNYVPSWMRQGRSTSVGTSGFVSPALTTPNSAGSDEIPQWKKDLAQRRASRKEQSPFADTPQREVSTEPEWKKNVQLRKTRPGDTPAKEKQAVEPEWKKAAEEKRARLRNSTVEN